MTYVTLGGSSGGGASQTSEESTGQEHAHIPRVGCEKSSDPVESRLLSMRLCDER